MEWDDLTLVTSKSPESSLLLRQMSAFFVLIALYYNNIILCIHFCSHDLDKQLHLSVLIIGPCICSFSIALTEDCLVALWLSIPMLP